jgi:hypothetical protein
MLERSRVLQRGMRVAEFRAQEFARDQKGANFVRMFFSPDLAWFSLSLLTTAN